MMKDRQSIYKIIAQQRLERTKRSFRVYQVLKLIRREYLIELNIENKIPHKKMDKDMEKHIVEAFLVCGNPADPNDADS
jgi:hypothetical protein